MRLLIFSFCSGVSPGRSRGELGGNDGELPSGVLTGVKDNRRLNGRGPLNELVAGCDKEWLCMRMRRRATILEERPRRDREPRVGLETVTRPEKGSGGGVENIRGAGRGAEAAAGGPGRGSEVAVGGSGGGAEVVVEGPGGGAEAAAVVESTVWFEGKAADRTLF
jgi:hypothetical protein